MKLKSRADIKNLVITALFIALSFVGANIKIFGTIAFDSLPGFLAALLLGPVYGAAIALLGHLFTALTSGFPLSVPLHLVIAMAMAITMLAFGHAYKASKVKLPEASALIIAGIIGVIANGPLSLAFSMGTMAAIAGKEAATGLLALLPALVLGSAANIALAIILFKSLERIWSKPNESMD